MEPMVFQGEAIMSHSVTGHAHLKHEEKAGDVNGFNY